MEAAFEKTLDPFAGRPAAGKSVARIIHLFVIFSEQVETAQQNGTKDAFIESRERSEMEAAFENTLDPMAGSPATGKCVAGIINLFVIFSEQVETTWNNAF